MKKKFTDLVDFVGGKPVLFEGTKPYVSTGALKSTTISREDIELVEFINRPSRADLEVKKDDILFAKMAFTDKRILIDNDTSNYIYSTGFFAVRAKPNIITTECLYYLLNSKTFKDQKDANSTGATQKAITNSGLKKIYLRIPNYNNQKEIAEILSNIEKIISFKERQLKEYDQLIKSRFVEMFGDTVINEMGWEINLIKKLVSKEKNSLKAGPFGSSLKKEFYVEKGYKIYGQEQVILGDVNYGDYYIDEDRYKTLENCSIQYDDVLISLVGTYGELLIIPKEFEPGIINPRLMKITFNKDLVDTLYFKYFFKSESLKNRLSNLTHGGTMPILNLGIVKNIEMPTPPLELQKQFAMFVKQVDKLKFEVLKLLGELR